MCGYGYNAGRIAALLKAKKNSDTVPELCDSVAATAKCKTRRDKLAGDPIWTKIWHEFTAVKKGQQFRSKMVKHATKPRKPWCGSLNGHVTPSATCVTK